MNLINKFRVWRLKKKLRKALPIFTAFDGLLRKAGIPRTSRRQFWRSMACDDDRAKAIDYMAKAIGSADFKEVN
jgi:uncharacterized protein YjiS (DUF1127 family)